MKINKADLILKILEVVDSEVCGNVEEFHIYPSHYGHFVVERDGKKIKVSVDFEEVEKND